MPVLNNPHQSVKGLLSDRAEDPVSAENKQGYVLMLAFDMTGTSGLVGDERG